MSNLIKVGSADMDSLIERCPFLLIEFSAKWCAPCRSFEQVLETVAPDYPEFTFAQIDIDQEKSLAAEFGIRSVPSVMILRNKVVLYADSGALSPTILRDLLDQAKSVEAP
jgi:thioredoxin 1